MKKIAVFIVAAISITLYGCGVGVYSVNSGMADESAVCFVAAKRYDINVNIDGVSYDTKTIKQKPHKARRDIKRTANRQLKVTPGRHSVKVTKDGHSIYSKEIYVSANEIKIIEL